MSPSPEAQRPSVYHFVLVTPESRVAAISTWIHVPGGVVAFHDETSSVSPNPVWNQGEVQRAYEYVRAGEP